MLDMLNAVRNCKMYQCQVRWLRVKTCFSTCLIDKIEKYLCVNNASSKFLLNSMKDNVKNGY